jgi:glycosyltransferase involved in cell wall biosynthesis
MGVTVDVGVFDNYGRGDRRILEVAAPYILEGIVIPSRGQLDRSTITTLRKYIARRQPDLVHSHAYKTTFYALLARRRTSCRLIATYHNWLSDTMALRLYAALDKRLARFCDAAVGVSEQVAQELRRYVPVERVHHIANGVDIYAYRRVVPAAEAKRALGLPEDCAAIGFVGRVSAQKGIVYLLRALAALPPSLQANVQLIIVGDGDQRSSLTEQARVLGLVDRTHFLGARNDMLSIYSALDVFVLPSEREAFPMVVLEAMACGLPVIATDVGDTARIIEDGVSGRVIALRDVNALRQALGELLEDPVRAQRMGEAARERVASRFSSARMAQSYYAIYERLLLSPTQG